MGKRKGKTNTEGFSFEKILPFTRSKQIIFVGENHGVIENAFFIRDLVQAMMVDNQMCCLGLEYPISGYSDFEQAFSKRNFDLIQNHPATKIMIQDGRFSRAHFEILTKLYHSGVKMFFYDGETGNWDDRDATMHKNIEHFIKTNPQMRKLVLVAGNIHTSLDVLQIDRRRYKPLGSYFDRKVVFLINLQYHKGAYFNYKRREFPMTAMPSQCEEVIDSNQANYHIEGATPTR